MSNGYGFLLPSEIKEELDKFIVGQDNAKKALCVAAYNHYKRYRYDKELDLPKSNILLLGPSGSGKTYLVETLAKIINVPFGVADATRITQSGWAGDDPETVLNSMYAHAKENKLDPAFGIVFIDEIDKMGASKNPEEYQQCLKNAQSGLLKLIEGMDATIKSDGRTVVDHLNTKNILFIFAGAFEGLDAIISRRQDERTIGFNSVFKSKDYTLTDYTLEDLIEYGFTREFLGRIHVRVPMQSLTRDNLHDIIFNCENSLLNKYTKLLEMDGIHISLSKEVIDHMINSACDQPTGVRAIQTVFEELLSDIMFNATGNPFEENHITVTEQFITRGK